MPAGMRTASGRSEAKAEESRRLLVRMLGTTGQAIITTTNRHYFSDEELARATVIELPLDGSLAAGEAMPPLDDEAPPAPPELDAL